MTKIGGFMIKIDDNLVRKLEDGDFSAVMLDFWFSNYAFKYILATIKGCEKNLDSEMLMFISRYAQYFMFNPNANSLSHESLVRFLKEALYDPVEGRTHEELIEMWNANIVGNCEDILTKIVLVGRKHYESYRPVLEQLYSLDNETVRLYCAANLDFSKFLCDKSERVKKVALIRHNFEQKWNSLSDDDLEKQRIILLTSALEKGVISYFSYDRALSGPLKDQALIAFHSEWFQGIYHQEFDEDILTTIKDKRILADAINELIKSKVIEFKDELMPSCFKGDHQGKCKQKTDDGDKRKPC